MYFILTVLLIAMSLSCATVDSSDEADLKATSFDVSTNLADALPPSLWSPSRRKINANYYFLVGEYQINSGKVSDAKKMFELAYNLDPSPLVGSKLVSTIDLSGNSEQALLHSKKMVLLYPKNAAVRSLYGQLLLKNNLFENALKQFKKAIEIDSKNLTAHLGLIRVFKKKNKTRQALAATFRLVGVNPNFAPGWALRASLFIEEGKIKNALESARQAFLLSPKTPEYILIYAFALEGAGEHKKAAALYGDLFKSHPTNELLLQRMIGLYKRMGSLDNALRVLNKAKSKSSNSNGIKLQKSIILFEMQKYGDSAKLLKSIAESGWEPDRFRYLSGFVYEQGGMLDEALSMYASIGESSDLFFQTSYRRYIVYRRLGRKEEALSVARTAAAMNGERSREFYILGSAMLASDNEYDAAIEFLEEGVKRFPNEINLLFNLGAFYEKAKRYDECINIMKRIIKESPDHHAALNFIGYLYAELDRDLDLALEYVDKALELKPGDPYYLDSLGWIYFKLEDYEAAEIYLQKALKLAPEEGVILEHMGDVYRALEKKKEAVNYYNQALLVLEQEDRERVRNKLNCLEGVDTCENLL